MDTFCIRCGKNLPPGSLRYVVDIRVSADFDGYLTDEKGNVEVGMEKLIEEIEQREEVDLTEEVYLHRVYLICKDCRDRFVSNPLRIPWSPALG